MKQVIRVEHPSDGCGLFRSGGYRALIEQHSRWEDINYRHSDMSKFPTYLSDTELVEQVRLVEYSKYEIFKYNFAFHSLEILNEALTPD